MTSDSSKLSPLYPHYPMKVKPLDNYKLLGTPIVLDKDVVYEATWATNQPDWSRKRKIFVGEGPGVLLSAGEYVIVESDPPPDIHAIRNLLRNWFSSVDIPEDSNDNESGFIRLTDDRMRELLDRTHKMLLTLIEP